MKAAEARWRKLFNQAPGFMCILQGPRHVFEYANASYFDLIGPRDAIGKPLLEVLPEAEGQGFVSILDHVYTTGESYTGAATPILLASAREGESQQVFLDFVYQPIRDEAGSVTGIFVQGSDVTDRVNAHHSLREADRKKDEFLAMLSHELRNPLAPIFNALHLMKCEDESQVQRETREVIERQMKHMSRLVNDLLEVTRITTGRVKLRIELVNLYSIIRKAVERIRPMADNQKQNIVFSPGDTPIFLDADSTRLEQVIGNLLHNASKYNRQGGNIWIAVESGDDQVAITVRDDGPGIAPEFLPSIWDLFTQVEISPGRADEGLGIGLALVKNLVELHGGTVKVSSDGKGNGSEFTILLPVSAGKLDRPAAVIPSGSRPMRPLRILVIDDHRDAARMTGMVVKSWGHDVRVVNSGAEAFQCLQHFTPHVILLDLGMPYMDGYEVAREIRNTPLLKNCPIIAITGYGQAIDRRKSREAGINLHLTKPVEPAELKKVLMDQVAPKTA